jgi:hypothetical protein
MDKDEALKLALEALEVSTAAQNKRAASKYAEWRWLKATGLSQKEESELKDAYYESEKEAAECEYRRDFLVVETIAVIKQALAAPVQPVADAWMHKDGRLTDAKAKTARVENFHGWRPLAFISSAAQPSPVQEPEYWNVIDPAGNIVASETDAIRGWARIAGSYKPTVEGLLGFHDQGWRVLPKVTPPAQPAVPDALTSADIQEHIEYVAGWNECRQAMLEMMK